MRVDGGIFGVDVTAAEGLDGYGAFLALHRHAGNVPPDTVGVATSSVAEALEAFIEADEVPDSARLQVLSGLAANDFPEFREAEGQYIALAEMIAGDRYEELLEALKADAFSPGAFLASDVAASLAHEVVAFYGEEVCQVYRVRVDGKTGVWLYSEFQTDAPFKSVAEWVDPHNWPVRSPMVFKSMQPVGGGGVTALPGVQSGKAWHADFHEQVELAKTLNTELHCDFVAVADTFAGMSYQLVRSIDNDIDVDRGFLLVNELGATRHVKCLKVVGFTNDYWDEQALMWACLGWTTFIQDAVRDGSHSEPADPTAPPGTIDLPGIVDRWFDCADEAAQRYTAMGTDWLRRAAQPTYSTDEAVRDVARFWLAVTEDWVNASAEAYATVRRLSVDPGEVAPAGGLLGRLLADPLDLTPAGTAFAAGASGGAGVAAAPGFEGSTLPIDGLVAEDLLDCGDMVRLGSKQDRVAAADVTVTTQHLGGDHYGIHVALPVSNISPGLYIGDVQIASKGSRPIQVYVSRARETAPSGP